MTRDETRAGILQHPYLLATMGSCALVFLAAFESMAVTTIMPLVSRELNGSGLYALAFAGPLATGVIGMVVAGNWADRRGPAAPLYASVALFAAGLLIAGTAVSMPILVGGRLVQGLGGGALTVALYVVIARVYPSRLHAQVFAAFSAAWVIPSMIGPFAAGVVAELSSWHWVFLGVVGLVVPALAMILPAIRGMGSGRVSGSLPVPSPEIGADPEPVATVPWAFGRMGWAALAALAVLGLNLSGHLPGAGGAIAVVALFLAVLAVRPLVPRGTLVAQRGLPAVILMRGIASAAFFGAEVYVPYLLTDRYSFLPAFAGLALTGSALSWAGASAVQGRLGSRLGDALAVRIGSVSVLGAIATALATTVFSWPAGVAIVGWLFAGAGMGLMYPRLSVMTLAMSGPEDQGFNSSAMSISDSLGGALSLATTGLVFVALTTTADAPFAGVFALTAGIAVVGLVIAPRVAGRPTLSKRGRVVSSRPSGKRSGVESPGGAKEPDDADEADDADDVRA
ncbi:MFS transporter [bacterium RCC_150]